MTSLKTTPHWELTAPTKWTNYHENFTTNVDGIYLLENAGDDDVFAEYNATTNAIQRLIRQASTAGRELRPVGSGWSLSDVAATTGRIVNNKNLKFYFDFEDERLMDSGFKGDCKKIFCFQAGMTIKSISRALDEEKLSLQTSGASNGQTIAGALSTGTHGAAIAFGAIPEFVVALHLATGKASSIWLERETDPIVDPEVVASFGAELVRSDEQFNAALVGLGAFGILISVTIRAVPRYLLEVHVKELPRDDALRRAMDDSDFAGLDMGCPNDQPYNFSMVVNPYRADTAYVTLMYKRRYRKDYPRHDFYDPDSFVADDTLNVLGNILDSLPFVGDLALPSLVASQLDSRYEEVAGVFGTHAEVFPATKTRGALSSTAIAVPAHDATRALQLFLDVLEANDPFAGAIGVRFVKGTTATLGFTRFPTTCVLEADGLQTDTANAYNEALWDAFANSDFEHTMHWGKLNNLTPERVRAMYGDARVDSWLGARRELVPASTRSVFSNAFLRRVGLSAV